MPDLVPLRHERMQVSPFTFYRGAAVIMAADLATAPNTGLRVQACGDAHLSNFGGFSAPDRALLFDINDFDETSPGPFEWDVKRLAASFEIAARSRSFSAKETRGVVARVTKSYREAMAKFAKMTQPRRLVRTARRREGVQRVPVDAPRPTEIKRFERNLAKAAGEGQHEGVRQAHRGGRRRVPHQGRSAGGRPARRPAPDRRRSRRCAAGSRTGSGSTGARCSPIGATSSRATGWSTSPARSSASAASARGAGSR